MSQLPSDPLINQYETFLNEKLRGDLEKLRQQLDRHYKEIAEYLELQQMLIKTREFEDEGFKTRVDLGCNFYARAETDPVGAIMVCVGLGVFVEMRRCEALKFIEKKIRLLEETVSGLKMNSAKVKANIKMVLGILRELQFGSHKTRLLICLFTFVYFVY